MNKYGDLNQHEMSAADLIESAIVSGKIVVAYDAINRKTLSIGPYSKAIDDGTRFAVLGNTDPDFRHVADAAYYFVIRVGSTRAREAAKKSLKDSN